MMKLTVAFLAALAAADAAEARTHRHARRQYGAGYGEVPAVSSKESPKYNPTSAEVFVSSVPTDAYAPPTVETPVPTSAYGSGFEEGPEVPVFTSSAAVDYGNGYGEKPAETPKDTVSSAYPSSKPVEGGEVYPTGVYPSSSKPVEGGVVYPTGSSSKPVEGETKYPGTGYAGTGYYPGTGYQPSSTPVSDYVSSVATPVPTEYVTSKIPISEVEECTTETLTYTVGVGSSAHPIVTEVTHTRTSTIYQTITVGKTPKPTPEIPAGGEDYPVSSSTITVKSTTTSTKYITVKPTPTEVPAGGLGKPEDEEDCAVPATVTVTAKETVYVTKPAEKPTPTPEIPAGGEDKSEDSYPEYPASTASATASVKYPVHGNGSYPLYPTGPTGFQTSTKPSYPSGTGYVKPSETSSLPYFSFVSEPYPEKTPIAETKPTPSPSAAPSYGNGYGEVPAEPEAETSSSYPVKETSKATPSPTASADYGSGYGTY